MAKKRYNKSIYRYNKSERKRTMPLSTNAPPQLSRKSIPKTTSRVDKEKLLAEKNQPKNRRVAKTKNSKRPSATLREPASPAIGVIFQNLIFLIVVLAVLWDLPWFVKGIITLFFGSRILTGIMGNRKK